MISFLPCSVRRRYQLAGLNQIKSYNRFLWIMLVKIDGFKNLGFFLYQAQRYCLSLKVPEIKIAGSWENHGEDVPASLPFPYIVPSSSNDPGTLVVYQSVIHVSNIEDHILQLLYLLVFFFLLVTFSSIYSAISTSGVSQMRMKKPYWWFSYWSFNLLKFFKVVVTSTHTYLIACMCLYKSRMSLPSGFSLFRIITVSQAVKQVCHFREGKGSQWFHVFLSMHSVLLF